MTYTLDNLNALKADFFDFFRIKPYDFEVAITSDLNAEFAKRRPDLKLSPNNDLNQFNGTIVQPKNKRDPFCILINKRYCTETIEKGTEAWIGTFAHEATHMNDYIAYKKLSGAKSYDEIRYSDKHSLFFFWTEFHARKSGYSFWQKKTGVTYDNARLKMITLQEYVFQRNYLKKKLALDASGYIKLYYVCQFLGRYAVWAEAYPEYFTQDLSEKWLGKINGQLMDFYRFFSSHQSLPDAVKSFSELEKISEQGSDFML